MNLTSFLKKMTASTPDPHQMRLRQHLLLATVVGLGGVVYYFVQGSSGVSPEAAVSQQKEQVPLATPYDAINPQDVWAGRIQKEAEDAKAEAKAVRDDNQLLAKKIELMEKILQGLNQVQGKERQDAQKSFAPSVFGEISAEDTLPKMDGQSLTPPTMESFPPWGSSRAFKTTSTLPEGDDDKLFDPAPSSSKFLQLSLSTEDRHILKNVDNYVPAGSYARAVCLNVRCGGFHRLAIILSTAAHCHAFG